MNYEKYSEVIIPPEADLKLPTNNNSRYFYNNKIKELVLDVVFNTSNSDGETVKPREFKLQLADPLIIDVEHDIFLDTVVTYNLKSSKFPQNMAFLLKIDQFNIQTKSATNIIKPIKVTDNGVTTIIDNQISNRINNSIMIPNEKAHETIETVIVKTTVDVASPPGESEVSDETIILNPTALGASNADYYNGYTLLVHTDNATFTTTVTESTGTATPELTVTGFKDLSGALPDQTADGVAAGALRLTGGTTTVELFKQYNNHSTIHKGRKHNYVGTITPSKLANITGSVSDMGSLTFNSPTGDGNLGDGHVTYGNPFHDATAFNSNIENQERLVVEFKLVPRQ